MRFLRPGEAGAESEPRLGAGESSMAVVYWSDVMSGSGPGGWRLLSSRQVLGAPEARRDGRAHWFAERKEWREGVAEQPKAINMTEKKV